MHNLKWTNSNPKPETVCGGCAPFIGEVFAPDTELPLPVHLGCYCIYFPTDEEPTIGCVNWVEMSQENPKGWMVWVRKVAWMLRSAQPIPWTLEPLRDAAEEYNRGREEKEQSMSESRPEERVRLVAGRVRLDAVGASARRYECTLIESGENKNGWVMPVEVLGAALSKFSGAPCLLDHHWSPPLEKFAGTYETPLLDGGAVAATLRIADTPVGDFLVTVFDAWLDDKAAGLEVADVGLSAVLWLKWRYDDESERWTAREIVKVESVDAVLHPAAGGRVERVLNSVVPPSGERSRFSMSEEQVVVEGGQEGSATSVVGLEQALVAVRRVADRVEAMVEELVTERRSLAAESEPEVSQGNPVEQYLGSLADRIEALTARVAEHEAERTITGMGRPPRGRVHGMTTGLDRIQLALEALLEGRRPEGVRPLTGIREMYHLLSGDYEMTGIYQPDRVELANVNSSTMANMVANALNKVLINTFVTYPRWWEAGGVSAITEVDRSSLQDVRWTSLGGVGELPTVVEGGSYTELTWDDFAETDAFVKKGGYLGITLETIDKDDIGRVTGAPRALAQASWLTLGKLIAAVFTDNSGTGPTMSDGNALFDATNHSNLLTSALSYAQWETIKIAMMKQAEINSSERLGALTRPFFLWVPVDLETTAVQILASEGEPGTADNDVNVNAQGNEREVRLANARRRVVCCPLWTDTNNWGAQADPRLYPALGVAYRFGRTPEIFSVASPTAGLMFTNDTLPVKVRFFVAVGPTDWRGLHKSNV